MFDHCGEWSVRCLPNGWLAAALSCCDQVDYADDGANECTYLHMLFPTDTSTAAMPACSMREDDGNLVVTVGELSYTFKLLSSPKSN